MDTAEQLHTAIETLKRLGIEVRYAHLGGSGGGLCELSNRRMAFIDLDADVATRLSQCLTIISGLPEADRLFLPPALREAVEELRKSADAS